MPTLDCLSRRRPAERENRTRLLFTDINFPSNGNEPFFLSYQCLITITIGPLETIFRSWEGLMSAVRRESYGKPKQNTAVQLLNSRNMRRYPHVFVLF